MVSALKDVRCLSDTARDGRWMVSCLVPMESLEARGGYVDEDGICAGHSSLTIHLTLARVAKGPSHGAVGCRACRSTLCSPQ